MKAKYFLTCAALLCVYYLPAQQVISGTVVDVHQKPIQYALIQLPTHTYIHTQTDSVGYFHLHLPDSIKKPFWIVVNQLGYIKDSLYVCHETKLNIVLRPQHTQEVVITERQNTTLINTLPIREEVITDKEFRRAACCSVSESFETNPSVDVTYADASSGIRKISLLGLSGKYVLLSIENTPLIRGLNLFSGLTDIPASWVEEIHVSKGIGSVLQGYESITGQIQINFYCPETVEDRVFLRGYTNHLSRSEISANVKHSLGRKWTGITFLHTGTMPKSIDQNQDGFMDMAMHNVVTGLQKWTYRPNDKWEIKTVLRGLYETRTSGQVHQEGMHSHNTMMYNINIENQRMDYFIKAGRSFEKKGRSLGILYSGIHHQQDAKLGRYLYAGYQNLANFQVIYDEPLHINHSTKFSLQYRYEDILEKNAYLFYRRTEHTLGGIAEHTWKRGRKHTLLTGARVDYHNLWGWILTPRVHTKWSLFSQTTLRLILGKGTRIPNIITENFNSLASSRVWIIQENLKPEIGWNFGISVDKKFILKNRAGRWSVESFYTVFKQQVIEDYDANSQAILFYNLQGKSYAFYTQAEIEYELFKNLTSKLAYKYYDVKITFQDKMVERPFVSKHRGLGTLSYLTHNEKWQFDLTLQYHGKQRLPSTRNNPILYQRPDYAPSYWLLLAQVQFISKKRWEAYLGGENLLNVKQPQPIISPDNPYSPYFDTTLVYAPIVGRVIYIGIRWKW
ncbi:MAG: TonB-dependent receptor [Bacteroidia bacterium]|nr:TonB-dependent receptor [Bacteroidia bacterium]MDW8346349.1 TonB-dependent receptor [Bacteroidia bacterium]